MSEYLQYLPIYIALFFLGFICEGIYEKWRRGRKKRINKEVKNERDKELG